MPGAGTDKTKAWIVQAGPIVVLVEPQLGENIGAAARVMANFGLARLRLVKPRDGWPNLQARRSASGADRVLDEAVLYDDVAAAIADCSFVLASTARAHDQAKPVVSPEAAAREIADHMADQGTASGEVDSRVNVAILFGRERYGLENAEVALADRIVTFPVNPAFASLNLAQAVALLAYEWFKLASAGALPFVMPRKSEPAVKEQLFAFFAGLERELDRVEFFRPPEKRATMMINLRNIFARMQPTRQDIQTLHGVILAIAEGRKGPARGGVLSGEEAEMLRALLAEHGEGLVPNQHGPVRGLARLLRRNPTEAERALWSALTNDRRFAGRGFKRQVPIGPHINDFVSFALRIVVEMVPDEESAAAAAARAQRTAWLEERGYRILALEVGLIERDVSGALDWLAAAVDAAGLPSKA
ncbi:MAG TPA: TrmJ/YjtD family RNA methyltransferase [Xanthobacteraceae bacterium]|jgi:tRNA/rRNA methyltransferase|nr:TrmJ/YjtD family RNA methyltransferase [Xanthobacteraceae bacterium]